VHDLPGGSWRFVVDADGYVALVVNGEVLLESSSPVTQACDSEPDGRGVRVPSRTRHTVMLGPGRSIGRKPRRGR